MLSSTIARVASMAFALPISGWCVYTVYASHLSNLQSAVTLVEAKNYTLQRFNPYMKADITVVATGYMEALDKGGGQLNQYINGANSRLQEIETLRPVHVQRLTEEEAKEEPLFTHLYERLHWDEKYGKQDKYRISYILDPKYLRPMLGKPNNPAVQVREVFVENVAICYWYGFPTSRAIERRRQKFEQILKENGIPYKNIRWADYSDKYSFPFLRRNALIAQITEEKG